MRFPASPVHARLARNLGSVGRCNPYRDTGRIREWGRPRVRPVSRVIGGWAAPPNRNDRGPSSRDPDGKDER
jgi:hypothetical protein